MIASPPVRRGLLSTAIPANAVLEFWHHYDVERGTGSFDGIVVEYSLDGTTWTDILAANPPIAANANRFLQNGYTETINTVHGNPLAGRLAWSGANVGFGIVRVDLADFAGHAVRFRWRVGTDDCDDPSFAEDFPRYGEPSEIGGNMNMIITGLVKQQPPRFLATIDLVRRVLEKEELLTDESRTTLKGIRESMLHGVSAARDAYSAADRAREPTDWVKA